MNRKGNYLLYPISLVYHLITGFRNFLFDSGIFRSTEFSIPVICIGNITVGGTGKTPHTEYLLSILSPKFRVAVLSRGYKRKSKGFMIVTATSRVADSGDEPLQIASRFPDVVVAVDSDRVKGINKILELYPSTEVILLDDGFQHRRVTPGFSILLSDHGRLFTRDHILPYGDLREDKSNIRRADVILVTKTPESISAMDRRLIVKEIDKSAYQNLYFTSIQYGEPVPIFGETNHEILKNGALPGVLIVTGIANPEPLRKHLESIFSETQIISFPDHHNFTQQDIDLIISGFNKLQSQLKYLITTEKDAVRLREFTNIAEPIKSAFYFIPVGINILNDDKEEFDNLIIDYVRTNHRNYRVSEEKGNR